LVSDSPGVALLLGGSYEADVSSGSSAPSASAAYSVQLQFRRVSDRSWTWVAAQADQPDTDTGDWSYSQLTPLGGAVEITAVLFFQGKNVANSRTLALEVNPTPPEFTISSPQYNQSFAGGAQGASVLFTGRVSAGAGLPLVFPGPPFPNPPTPPVPLEPSPVTWVGDWGAGSASSADNWSATWQAQIQVPPGRHQITFTCRNTGGYTTQFTWFVTVTTGTTDILHTTEQDYLHALIEYATTGFRSDMSRIVQAQADGSYQNTTASELVAKFFQPLDSLYDTANSAKAAQAVRRVRIAVEVLRRYRAYHVMPDTDDLLRAQVAYRRAAYKALLNGLGTSYDEVRLARGAPPVERQELADRLGVDLGPARPDCLDNLFQNADAVTEAWLDRMFGLADPTRNPLSDGPIVSASANLVQQWNFEGVDPGRNTGASGGVYLTFTRTGTKVSAAAYTDIGKMTQVAFGSADFANLQLVAVPLVPPRATQTAA
jgi:hypothetical protein